MYKGLYSGYNEALTNLREIEKSLPDFIRIEKIGETWEKREIVVIIVTQDVALHETKPALFYTGTIHAREWIGIELALGFVEYLVTNLPYDSQIQDIFQSTTLYMVPCANPDGFDYARKHFSFWRKNRRQNLDGSFGVDLNRNFSVGFEPSNLTTSNVYSGPEPFSEPETRALRDFVLSAKNITIALDYHSQGNVFFPAHDFKHEDTIDTTDMNVLCANMAESIKKVSGKEYGIHQGKPPVKLIGGTGREFYYSLGIIATVVEVGTRNISDYLEDMLENVKEHIQALLTALEEVPNYAKESPLKRVENFKTDLVTCSNVSLSWNCEMNHDVYFEIYRQEKQKLFCNSTNRITKTQNTTFTDTNLQSATDYYYNIRAIDKQTKRKSPFAPQIHIKTAVDKEEFSRIYYASKAKTGYVAQFTPENKNHFGVNSLFVGVDEAKGISYAVVHFALDTIPANAKIKSAKFKMYPINRVSTTIEKYGEWNVGLVAPNPNLNIYDFDAVRAMEIVQYVGRPTQSSQLTQGIWRHWKFSLFECSILEEALPSKEVFFRIEGPKELPIGRKSQMMQWDLGYGKFSQGLNFRPILEINYTLEPAQVEIYPKEYYSFSKNHVENDAFYCGFDAHGNKIFTTLEYTLASLPDYDYTMITHAHLEINSTKIYLKEDVRFHLEFLESSIDRDYETLKNRITIENIGYDISSNDLKKEEKQYFIFDSFSLNWLAKYFRRKKDIAFLLRPTSSKKRVKDKVVHFHAKHPELSPKLVISYIHKRKKPVPNVTNFAYTIENGMIKLTWDNPDDADFKGVKVIKNPFRAPINPFDGQKLYGGKDNYTFDNFGAHDIKKFYAIFSYDDVPNFSNVLVIEYAPRQAKDRLEEDVQR